MHSGDGSFFGSVDGGSSDYVCHWMGHPMTIIERFVWAVVGMFGLAALINLLLATGVIR